MKARSQAHSLPTVCAIRVAVERRPSLTGTRSVAGVTDARSGQSVGAGVRRSRQRRRCLLRVLSQARDEAREAQHCPRAVRSARECEAVRDEGVERAAARAALTEPVREREARALMPDSARPETIRQPARVDWNEDVRAPITVRRARDVAKGPPRMTLELREWRPGACVWEWVPGDDGAKPAQHPNSTSRPTKLVIGTHSRTQGMSVRHTRARPCAQ